MTVSIPSINETNLKTVIRAIQQLSAGRSNAVGTVTLNASAASTTVTDTNCAAGTTPILVAATADAAAELKNGTIFIPLATIANGSFVIQHANNTQADRTFSYALLG